MKWIGAVQFVFTLRDNSNQFELCQSSSSARIECKRAVTERLCCCSCFRTLMSLCVHLSYVYALI